MAAGANAGEVRARLVLDNSQFRQSMQQARNDMNGLRGSSATAAQGLSQITTAAAAVGTAVVAAAGASVAAAANFEQGMAKVKAIGGATGSEFERLKKTALDLGSSTSFSATQAADGMALLAAAGFKTNDVIDSMPALLNLAAAANLDLATSADYLGSMMSGFGIKASDSGHAVDVLVRAMNDANTDLPDLAEAMKYVAPVAASLKIPFEDTAAAVALMSNAGIKGSQAGTTLRATLLSMANPVGQAAKAMEELGISYKNSNGEMKPLPEILDHVKGKMSGLTDAQKTQYAAMLVGTEASSGFLTLLKEGGGALTNFSTNLKNSAGSAQEMANTMRDTLMGDLDNFTGALETVGIKLGTALLPAARELLKIGANLANTIGELDPKMITAGLSAAGAAAGVALLATGAMKAVTAIRAFSLALVANPATAWIAGISIAVGALTSTLMAAKEETADFKEVSFDTYKSLDEQSNSLKNAANEFDAMRGKIKLNNDELLEYRRLQQDLERATDPRAKEEIQAGLDRLIEKSGVNNEQIQKTINLSDEIIKQSPSTSTAFNERGQAIATSTQAARDYAAELDRAKLAELELQKAQAMTNLSKNLEDYRNAVKDANDLVDQTPSKVEKVQHAEAMLARSKEDFAQKDSKLNEDKVKQAEKTLANAKEELHAHEAKVHSKTAEIGVAEQALQKGRQSIQQINEFLMKQVEVTYEKGNEIKALDQAIAKEREKISALAEAKRYQGELTDKQKEELNTANEKLGKLTETKTQIQENNQLQIEQNQLMKNGKEDVKEMVGELNKKTDKKVGIDKTEADTGVQDLNKYIEERKTKYIDGDPSLANARVGELNAQIEASKIKPVDANPTIANARIQEINSRIEESKTKPVDANPLSALTKVTDLNRIAEELKTKPIDANPFSALGKIGNIDAAAQAEKTKSVDADTSSANAKVNSLNQEASKPVTKEVTIWQKVVNTVENLFGGGDKRHNGGTTQSIRPKYHNGGTPIAQRPTRPKFDEVDVRLLKNEMVLTAGQQENLFNLIKTFNAGTAMNIANAVQSAQGGGGDIHNYFSINEMVVRDDHDIEKIAAELAQLERQQKRMRGY
ncbi:phage tail tape measure protein [Bacillus sp. JJ864]|uniref:phage tail tape measure protein n=1 Tax=Bacillus sp. JJ864 TaxID=3122975 RepID=UPI002FFE6181